MVAIYSTGTAAGERRARAAALIDDEASTAGTVRGSLNQRRQGNSTRAAAWLLQVAASWSLVRRWCIVVSPCGSLSASRSRGHDRPDDRNAWRYPAHVRDDSGAAALSAPEGALPRHPRCDARTHRLARGAGDARTRQRVRGAIEGRLIAAPSISSATRAHNAAELLSCCAFATTALGALPIDRVDRLAPPSDVDRAGLMLDIARGMVLARTLGRLAFNEFAELRDEADDALGRESRA